MYNELFFNISAVKMVQTQRDNRQSVDSKTGWFPHRSADATTKKAAWSFPIDPDSITTSGCVMVDKKGVVSTRTPPL